MKTFLKGIAIAVGVLVIIFSLWIFTNVRNRHPGYSLDLVIEPAESPGILKTGFAAVPITPIIKDTWIDVNNDAKYRPEDGDTFVDGNGNGKFDPVWIAGFHNRRAANGVHDDLWARAMVVDDGQARLALVSLDAIGFFHDDVVDVRKALPSELDIDYTIICSTHDHEAPDLLGLWGRAWYKTGVNKDYLAYVRSQTVRAIELAVKNMRPTKLRFAQDLTGAQHLVEDSRKPIVLDPGLRLIQAMDLKADTTLGTVIAWANHPETMWSHNLLVSSDFPHYVRTFVEEGVREGERLVMAGLGGTALYINGAIGGLMTTRPNFPIRDPIKDTTYTTVSFEKTRAQGQQVAMLVLEALRGENVVELTKGAISLRAKTLSVPLANKIYKLAFVLGVVKHGLEKWMELRTEIAAWRLGPASFITVPGEIYPEIVNGGVVSPNGGDFAIMPVEIPPLRNLMQGEFKFIFGLANDEIGYIIPKSEWDEDTPFLYGAEKSPYGEINSVGPEAAPIIHEEIRYLLEELQEGRKVAGTGF